MMEACDRGATAIASLLLQHGADVTLKNPDNWTALDFLRNAVTAEMVDNEDLPEADKLVAVLRSKLMEGVFGSAANYSAPSILTPKCFFENVNENFFRLQQMLLSAVYHHQRNSDRTSGQK